MTTYFTVAAVNKWMLDFAWFFSDRSLPTCEWRGAFSITFTFSITFSIMIHWIPNQLLGPLSERQFKDSKVGWIFVLLGVEQICGNHRAEKLAEEEWYTSVINWLNCHQISHIINCCQISSSDQMSSYTTNCCHIPDIINFCQISSIFGRYH